MQERFMLDTNIADQLAEDDGLREALRQAVGGGRLQLLVTHVQVDELLNTPDVPDLDLPAGERARRLLHALLGAGVRAVPSAAVLNVSRIGSTWLVTDEGAARIAAFMQENPKQGEDAAIAEAAGREGATFVTEEGDQNRRRFQRSFPDLQVWSLAQFRRWLAD
jgi:hypothetical protein